MHLSYDGPLDSDQVVELDALGDLDRVMGFHAGKGTLVLLNPRNHSSE